MNEFEDLSDLVEGMSDLAEGMDDLVEGMSDLVEGMDDLVEVGMGDQVEVGLGQMPLEPEVGMSGKHSRRMLAFANAQASAAKQAAASGDMQKAAQILASDPWHPNVSAQQLAQQSTQQAQAIQQKFQQFVASSMPASQQQAASSQFAQTLQQVMPQAQVQAAATAATPAASCGQGQVPDPNNPQNCVVDPQIMATINGWKQQCAQQGGTWDPTQGNPIPGNIPGLATTGACAMGPTQDQINQIKTTITGWQQQCAQQGGTWDPTQGNPIPGNIPGLATTGACQLAPAQPAGVATPGMQPQAAPQPIPGIQDPNTCAQYGGTWSQNVCYQQQWAGTPGGPPAGAPSTQTSAYNPQTGGYTTTQTWQQPTGQPGMSDDAVPTSTRHKKVVLFVGLAFLGGMAAAWLREKA